MLLWMQFKRGYYCVLYDIMYAGITLSQQVPAAALTTEQHLPSTAAGPRAPSTAWNSMLLWGCNSCIYALTLLRVVIYVFWAPQQQHHHVAPLTNSRFTQCACLQWILPRMRRRAFYLGSWVGDQSAYNIVGRAVESCGPIELLIGTQTITISLNIEQ